MSLDEMNVKYEELVEQLGKISAQMEELKSQRSDLLRQRFDLKEQRRYYRAQLREADAANNAERKDKVLLKLEELETEVDAIDEKIHALEEQIENLGDQSDDLTDAIGEAAAEPYYEPVEEKEVDWGAALGRTMDSVNDILRRSFKKAADALEKVDLDKVSDSVETYAAKAVETAKTAADKVETAWNEAKENRQKPGGIGDHRISGSGVMDGGCYNHISSSGSCKVSSDLVCREIKSSGAFRACGSVDCSGDVNCSGSFTVEKNLTADGLSGTGAVRIMGNLQAERIHVPGSLTVDGNISAGDVKVTGNLKTDGDVEADAFTASGLVNVGGIINADTVKIKLDMTQSNVGSIGGSHVAVTQGSASGILSSFLRSVGKLVTVSIEGDEIEFQNVEAAIVRGARVVIRSGCTIERVEYSESCSIDETSKVGECVKV